MVVYMTRDEKTTSKIMKKIKSTNTSIEVKLRKALWNRGYRYRKNYKELPGTPDIVIIKYKIAVFCDSEFFHGKDWEKLKVRLEDGKNPNYWIKKIERNRKRDMNNDKKLFSLGKIQRNVLKLLKKQLLIERLKVTLIKCNIVLVS